jgi:hypothetical protein
MRQALPAVGHQWSSMSRWPPGWEHYWPLGGRRRRRSIAGLAAGGGITIWKRSVMLGNSTS